MADTSFFAILPKKDFIQPFYQAGQAGGYRISTLHHLINVFSVSASLPCSTR